MTAPTPALPPFAAYRRVFAPPGALAFTLAGLTGRLSYSMLGVAMLTAIVSSGHSYALAGAVSAAGLAGVALGLPLLGRLVDRYGQRRVAVPAALCSAVPRTAAPFLIHWSAPGWLLCLTAFAASGAPNLGGMARARWAHLHGTDPGLLHSANSLEQALDELCFTAGPILGALCCTTGHPAAGLLLISVLSTGGGLLFAAQRRTEPPIAPAPPGGSGSPLRTRGTVLLLAVFLATGVVFGAMEITTLAWSRAHGAQAVGGLLLGLQAAGSGLSGVLLGLRPARSAPARRLLFGLSTMAACLLLPLAAALLDGGPVLLGVALFLAGTGTAPTMVTGMTLLQRVLPTAALNEGMAIAVCGIVVGISAGSALGGLVTQRTTSGAGFALPAAAAALALLLAVAGRRRFGR
ncbi:MFS transporter [Kitasatospora sp. NPDC058965]|uniref:MFS transporter n=1 Tax=Kitasatospora sp. NPDC058965 TaxID=3346682 RepID=UPI00367CC95B